MYYCNTNQMYPSILHLLTRCLSGGGVTLKRVKIWFLKDTKILLFLCRKHKYIYTVYKEMYYTSEVLKFHGGERLRKKCLKSFLGAVILKSLHYLRINQVKVKKRDLPIIKYQITA